MHSTDGLWLLRLSRMRTTRAASRLLYAVVHTCQAWLCSSHALGASAGTTPTTPRRMRALHEIPSLETQAHLGRRPSVPPDDEVCIDALRCCAIHKLPRCHRNISTAKRWAVPLWPRL